MKIIGVSDDVTTCECCGRTNLRRTIVLSADGGETFSFYGSTCAKSRLYNKALTKANMERIGLSRENIKHKERIKQASNQTA